MEDSEVLCKKRFTVSITNWLSWDDLLNLTYFGLNLAIVILATVNTVKLQKHEISEEESKRLVFSQKIIRLVAGIMMFFIGVYNLTLFFNVVHYSASNRALVGISQLIMSIVFIVLMSLDIHKFNNNQETQTQ